MVELRPAYAWDCEDCGTENFTRGMVPEFSPDDLEELRDEHGIQPWETGAFVAMPEAVKCNACGAVFSTQHIKDA